jgi:hypothetical protein
MHQLGIMIQTLLDGLPKISEALVKALVEKPVIALILFTMMAMVVLPYVCKYVMRKCFPEEYLEEESVVDDLSVPEDDYEGMTSESDI